MKSWAEMIAFISANIGKPERTLLKGFSISAFGHQVDPVGRNI